MKSRVCARELGCTRPVTTSDARNLTSAKHLIENG